MKPALSIDKITLDKQLLITISAAIINMSFILIYAFNDLSIFDQLLMFMMYLFNTMTMYFLEVKDIEYLNIMHMCMVFCFMLTIFIDNMCELKKQHKKLATIKRRYSDFCVNTAHSTARRHTAPHGAA